MTSRVARDVAPCDQLQLIGDKLHELKRLLPILHFHSLLETVERTPVDPNGSDTECANTSDNGAGAMTKPKTYLRLPEIPTLVTSHDLRGSKALVLLGYRDCSYETHRYMVEVENMPEDDPLVLGLQQHLEQHWLRMDIQTLLSDVLDNEDNNNNTDCNANSGNNNASIVRGVSIDGTDSYCSSRGDSGDDGGGNSVGHRRPLCQRHPLHRRHRHHPHQRNHHQRHQPCSQPRSQYPLLQHHQSQSFVDTLVSSTELNPLTARVTGNVGNEMIVVDAAESQRMDNESSSRKHELQLELQPVTSSSIIVKPAQSPPSSSPAPEPVRSSEGCVRALLTSEGENPLLAAINTTNNNNNNNNNDINELSNDNEVGLKEEDPERWKALNLSIARVTQELIVLLENEGTSLSDDEDGEEGYDEDEEDEDEEEDSDADHLVQDIDLLNNGLEN